MKTNPIELAMYTCPGYDFFLQKWKRCRDVYAGSDNIKNQSDTYLPKNRWHKEGGKLGEQDYNDYKSRAVFYSYMRDAVETVLGVLKKGDTVALGTRGGTRGDQSQSYSETQTAG